MAELKVEDISNDRMSISVQSGDSVEIVLSGDIDMEDPGILLDPFFEEIHNQMVDQKIENIIADFSALNFLNSSGIKSIAKWILKQAVVPEPQYSIEIQHNKEITWQVTSLPTLTFLVPGVVKIL